MIRGSFRTLIRRLPLMLKRIKTKFKIWQNRILYLNLQRKKQGDIV